jgi:ubiquinone/menaquinone biosynthesis C-methylase UbiE
VLTQRDRRLGRFQFQNEYWRGFTLSVLTRAGVAPGMRVLDIGCGPGHVSTLAASLVGLSGSVVGIDRSEKALVRAAAAAQDEHLANLSFVQADVDGAIGHLGQFDAIVGRFVLMYLPDPVSTLRRLSNLLVPGGIVAFVEMDVEASKCVPRVPFIDHLLACIVETLKHAQAATALAPQVWRLLRDSGFADPANEVLWEASPAPARRLTQVVAETVCGLYPRMQQLGILERGAMDVQMLAEQLQAELLHARATLMPPAVVGTWARMQP